METYRRRTAGACVYFLCVFNTHGAAFVKRRVCTRIHIRWHLKRQRFTIYIRRYYAKKLTGEKKKTEKTAVRTRRIWRPIHTRVSCKLLAHCPRRLYRTYENIHCVCHPGERRTRTKRRLGRRIL